VLEYVFTTYQTTVKGFFTKYKRLLFRHIFATSQADALESSEVLGLASVIAMLFFVALSLQSLMNIQVTVAMAYATNRWPFYYVNRDTSQSRGPPNGRAE